MWAWFQIKRIPTNSKTRSVHLYELLHGANQLLPFVIDYSLAGPTLLLSQKCYDLLFYPNKERVVVRQNCLYNYSPCSHKNTQKVIGISQLHGSLERCVRHITCCCRSMIVQYTIISFPLTFFYRHLQLCFTIHVCTVYYLCGHAHIQSIPGAYFDSHLYQRKIGLVTLISRPLPYCRLPPPYCQPDLRSTCTSMNYIYGQRASTAKADLRARSNASLVPRPICL